MAWLTTMATLPQLTANLYRQILVYPSLQHSQMECFDQAPSQATQLQAKGCGLLPATWVWLLRLAVRLVPCQGQTSCQDTKTEFRLKLGYKNVFPVVI